MDRIGRSGKAPRISYYAYEDVSSQIIGNVIIEDNVFIGPGAILRAEAPGSSIHIRENTNIQDRVVICAHEDDTIYVGMNSSLAHGCIVVGSVSIGDECFVGFGSVISNAELRDSVFVTHMACIENCRIPDGRYVPSGMIVQDSEQADGLEASGGEQARFVRGVVQANLQLTEGYMQ